jgi:DNA-binding response OmpR family regulator
MCAILLVEDHADTRRAFAAILRSWGHQVITRDSATAGLEALKVEEVDVVVSDIGLPDQNGYDFISQVRRQKPGVATIAVSAYFTAADHERGHDAGFDMYFAKPVDLTALERALGRIDSHAAINGAGKARSAEPGMRGQETGILGFRDPDFGLKE